MFKCIFEVCCVKHCRSAVSSSDTQLSESQCVFEIKRRYKKRLLSQLFVCEQHAAHTIASEIEYAKASKTTPVHTQNVSDQ
jgi:hypothetical protein